MGDFPQGHFGSAIVKPIDWRNSKEVDPDNEQIVAPKDVVMMLGFDPAKAAAGESQ